MGYVISTANMKGGVGKTTLSVNLATSLAKDHGKRVLVIDLDTQISATLSLMSPADFAKRRKGKRTLRYLVDQAIQSESQSKITTQDVIQSCVCKIEKLDLLPGDIDLYDEFVVSEMLHKQALSSEQFHFEKVWNRFERLLIGQILEPVFQNYDFIILDCAPGYNLMTRSALVASDLYLMPAKPEPLSIVGIQLLERRIAKLKESHDADGALEVEMLGVVFTMLGNLLTGRYYRQVMQRVNQDFGTERTFRTQIPNDVNVSKAVDSFMPVVLTNPQSAGAKAFTQLTEEFLQKLKVLLDNKEPRTKLKLTSWD
ncbi:MAG: ParA family protein [Chroococcidiopsidaceae cyanobacterium CP_BM_ER_R8_30]|nr:ParA family protein [Chroococcidiopsidaceae cyanobacterium CP_BM_ER_R8_30]